MRIRKRQVPLPFSSISPVPLSSDPNFNQSPVVQLPLRQHPSLPTLSSDDHPNNHPIGQHVPTQGRDSSAFHGTTTKTHGQELGKKENYSRDGEEEEDEDEEKRGEGEKSNDTRKKNVVGAELGTGSLPQSESSHQAVRRWGEGEKAFPLKKRRGSFERRSGNDDDDDDDTLMADQKDNNTNKMKTKMKKKFAQEENEQEEKESKLDSVDKNNNVSGGGAKKRGRGGALMEGSRCSRVNGRGWRCCQQTLVGYSLCEHHLGKGRLRSMTSVRSRSLANNNAANEKKKLINVHEYLTLSNDSNSSSSQQTKRELVCENGDEEEEGKDDQKPLMMTTTTKKRVKLGMVKARSISSLLLGQNHVNNATAIADDHNN